ncbi:hypothetical protein Taro_007599 [Colocasia esculenta]|uniref:Uncharacterized protein n=1 Tax=Colocasia esculenta TaxID=4460 RepID=A0A843TZE4_COLES|nr:hypothetical protein [Colocasia esculenta]
MNIPYNLNLADGASFHERSISAVISSVVNVLPQNASRFCWACWGKELELVDLKKPTSSVLSK